mmetsp:Transcript_6642/g.16915  ORF Transcript_6642/g.16915 Transcript_6642/m.16915 type:complete len:206 (-) Transcript_6642:251-868(-)
MEGVCRVCCARQREVQWAGRIGARGKTGSREPGRCWGVAGSTRRPHPLLRLRAKKDAEEVYDYGTEKIRSLLKRDSKELKGLEGIGDSAKDFAPDEQDEDEAVEAVVTPKSPFGDSSTPSKPKASGSSSKAAIGSQKMLSPFKADARDMDVRDDSIANEPERPWWQPEITMTQVFLFCSFGLIITLTILTFVVVFKTGAVRFNDV